MSRRAIKVSDKAPTDKPLTGAAKAAATARTAEQQAMIERDREALARHDAGQPPLEAGETAVASGASTLEEAKAAAFQPAKDPGEVDAARRAPRPAHGRSSHIVDGGDKVDNLATAFHEEQERSEDAAAPLSRRARAHQGTPMSEEDRRRAILDSAQGVDTFAREAGEPRPNEPTLQQCNAQFFKEEDHKMARKVELQESVGTVLHEAFGATGARRIQKNLR